MTSLAVKDTASFVSDFNQVHQYLPGAARPAVNDLRQSALASFEELGVPGPRNEDWKFTSLAPLTRVRFELTTPADGNLDAEDVKHLVGMQAPLRLVFVNGQFAPTLSALPAPVEGVRVTNLASALEQVPDLVESHLGQQAPVDEYPFIALNTAFFQDGVFLHLAPGKVVEEPIHLVFLSTAPGTAARVTYPRNLLVLSPGSQATVVEHHVGLADECYFSNAVTEVAAGSGAFLDHYKLQQEGSQAFHIAATQVHQQRDSNFSTHFVGLGGALVRNEVRVALLDQGCEATVNGVYQASGTQHMDNHTVIDHASPHCNSHELYKGILDGRARGVFNGKIFVRQDAQKTDAKQTNQTLLLSDDATINTKPQLEIYADDVKCTHGATVGQLDANALFYMRSRGLGVEQARHLLIHAFANDVIARIKIDSLRDSLEQRLLATRHLAKVDSTEERV